jgi:hypothetical protein
MHVLPKDFQRIRQLRFPGQLLPERKLALCRQLLRMPPREPSSYLKKDYRQRYEELTGRSLTRCPFCQQGRDVRDPGRAGYAVASPETSRARSPVSRWPPIHG